MITISYNNNPSWNIHNWSKNASYSSTPSTKTKWPPTPTLSSSSPSSSARTPSGFSWNKFSMAARGTAHSSKSPTTLSSPDFLQPPIVKTMALFLPSSRILSASGWMSFLLVSSRRLSSVRTRSKSTSFSLSSSILIYLEVRFSHCGKNILKWSIWKRNFSQSWWKGRRKVKNCWWKSVKMLLEEDLRE